MKAYIRLLSDCYLITNVCGCDNLSLTTQTNPRAKQLLRWTTVCHNRHGSKSWSAVPLSVGGAGSPSNAMSPGLWPTSVPSGILIHPAVWPQLPSPTHHCRVVVSVSTSRLDENCQRLGLVSVSEG